MSFLGGSILNPGILVSSLHSLIPQTLNSSRVATPQRQKNVRDQVKAYISGSGDCVWKHTVLLELWWLRMKVSGL